MVSLNRNTDLVLAINMRHVLIVRVYVHPYFRDYQLENRLNEYYKNMHSVNYSYKLHPRAQHLYRSTIPFNSP